MTYNNSNQGMHDGVVQAKKRVLVIDDDQDTVHMIKEALEQEWSMQVEVAYNGKEGLDKMHAMRFDLVIMEVLVPKLNGIDVCESMWQDDKLKNIPVLLTSMLPLTSDAFKKSLETHQMFAVVKDTIEKPFGKKELLTKTINLLA